MRMTILFGSLLAVFLMLMIPVSSTVQCQSQKITNSIEEIIDEHNMNTGLKYQLRYYFFGKISNLSIDIENKTYDFCMEFVLIIKLFLYGIREWSFEIGLHTIGSYELDGFDFRGHISGEFIFGYFFLI
ncbi:MAG: hypothetical protein QCI00_09455 [Candidatus Thermoplasmatota archaeon]|nr:hypothetical protein [Candidatus Thermoplasmatota archaeon]